MKKTKKLVPYIFLVFMFLIISFSFRDNPFSNALSGHDSSMFLYFGKGISDGLIPYKNMLDHKGPVLFLIQYLAFLIGTGNINLGIWIVECFFLIGSILFLYKTNFIFTGDRNIAAIALLFLTPLFVQCYEGGNLSEEYALLFISFSMYMFSKSILNNELSKLNYILIGFFGALTFFIRMNMISVWVVYCLYLVYINIKDRNFTKLLRQFKYILLGGVITVVLITSLSIYQGNFKDMINQAFLMNIAYSGSTIGEKFQATLNYVDILLKFGIFPLIIIYFISLFDIQKQGMLRLHYPLIAYFFFNFITVILSGRSYYHYLTTEIVPVSVIVAMSIQFILRGKTNKKKRIISFLLIMVIVLPTSYGIFKSHAWMYSNIENAETNQIEEISKFIKDNTTKQDTIYVHNLDANIYLLSNRYSNSKFFVLPAINYDKFPELKKEFDKSINDNPPKFIVLEKSFFSNKDNSSNLNMLVSSAIEKNYHLVTPIKSDIYSIYEIDK